MQRLKTRPQFQAALAGKTVARTAHFALHRCPLDFDAVQIGSDALPLFTVSSVWVGAMVPKRWAKRAVTRNAIKRQIYQLSADFEATLPHSANVVRLRSAFDRAQFVSATSELLKSAVREELHLLFSNATATNP